MRIDRAMACNKSQYLIFVQLHNFAGNQIISGNNDRLFKGNDSVMIVCQYINQSLRNILYICGTFTHIGVVHSCKHIGKFGCCHTDGIFRILPLILYHVGNRAYVVHIFQHHLMNLKNHCAGTSHFQ